ncbi:hypothetical protein Pcinc_015556 [Petrolisthes cinctipes]|nr:hypothetical protein Pcinc_043890 [Petrolisthes cinctipes]KAK3879913.1 hypothetical protein Pcinc_015556 [Petrolisthes cinctipes]
MRYDEQKYQRLMREVRCEEIKAVEVVRLGRREEGRRRPLLVKLDNEQRKYEVLKNAKNLKNTKEEWAKRVQITKDLTIREREETRKALEALREKRERGEQGWYVRDGRLLKFKRYQE